MMDVNCKQITEFLEAAREFEASGEAFFWQLDPGVLVDMPLDDFLGAFEKVEADVLACEIRELEGEESGMGLAEGPDWASPERSRHGLLTCNLCCFRLSVAATRVVVGAIGEGRREPLAVLIPTVCHAAGLIVEDIGGRGKFCPPERFGKWYGKATMGATGREQWVPGKLHFRAGEWNGLMFGEGERTESPPTMLFVLMVGAGAEKYLAETLQRFLGAGADCRLVQYDEAELEIPPGVDFHRERGQKWQLARRHLEPETVAQYDYIFIWDDDIDVLDFNPLIFVEIMSACRLDVAQPAIVSAHPLAHAITEAKPLVPSAGSFLSVGRLTNFVEIMVPVYSRQAWQDFYPYLDDENLSGYGYDSIPFNRQGIIDLMPVNHTRPVQSSGGGDYVRFCNRHGIFAGGNVNEGLLLVDTVRLAQVVDPTVVEAEEPLEKARDILGALYRKTRTVTGPRIQVTQDCLVFEVRDGEVIVEFSRQTETRAQLVEELLRRLVELSPSSFEGKKGYLTFGDEPPDFPGSEYYELAFASTKLVGEDLGYLPFPCPYALRWTEVGVADSDAMMTDFRAPDFDGSGYDTFL